MKRTRSENAQGTCWLNGKKAKVSSSHGPRGPSMTNVQRIDMGMAQPLGFSLELGEVHAGDDTHIVIYPNLHFDHLT